MDEAVWVSREWLLRIPPTCGKFQLCEAELMINSIPQNNLL